jgi:hypothetical protein
MSFVFAFLLIFVAYITITVVRILMTANKKFVPREYVPKSIGEITVQELAKYDGRDPSLPLLLAVRGSLYDVTSGKEFYGPGEQLCIA